jgi:glycosyltransferase involved in cell wall biosynthesis
VNILQVIPELEAGGAERTTIEVAEAVVAAGGRCLVASLGGRLEGELADAGGELVRLDMKTKNPLSLWRNAALLAALIEREGVDLVHARSRAPAWSAKWAARRTGRAFVTTYHGTYTAKSGLKRRYNAVMAAGDRVIANSSFIADHVRAEHGVGEDRLRVIPRGVDMARFDPGQVAPERIAALRAHWGVQPGEMVILLPGRLTAWKGQLFFIEALDGVRPGKLRLVCLGDAQGRTEYQARLRTAAQDRGLTLALPGHASDMPAAYLAADLVVCPSLQPEAFGRTAAEALAMGAPVIAAAHGGALEVIDPGVAGELAAPGDISAWRSAVTQALETPGGARSARAQAGRARITSQFSTAALQSATLQVYRELLE